MSLIFRSWIVVLLVLFTAVPTCWSPLMAHSVDPDAERESVFLSEPESAVLIYITLTSTDNQLETRRHIQKLVHQLPARQARFLDDGASPALPRHTYGVLIGIDPVVVPTLLSQLHSVANILVEVIPSMNLTSADIRPARSVGGLARQLNEETSLLKKVGLIRESLTPLKRSLSHATPEEINSLIQALSLALRDFEGAYTAVYETAYAETRSKMTAPDTVVRRGALASSDYIYEEARAFVAGHPLYSRFGEALQMAEFKIFQLLKTIGTPESIREILLAAPAGQYVGKDFMPNKIPTGGNFLDAWLSLHATALREADRMPVDVYSHNASEEWLGTQQGFSFPRLRIGENQSFWRQERHLVRLYLSDTIRFHPLPFVLLGLSADAQAEKTKIMQFIHESEITVARQLAKENAVVDARRLAGKNFQYVKGNAMLTSMIINLAAFSPSIFRGHAGFSEVNYYGNILDIFIELIRSSHTMLHNEGTYHAILDSALNLIRIVQEHEYGGSLAQKISELNDVILNKLLSAFPYAQGDVESTRLTCNAFLTPRPQGGHGERARWGQRARGFGLILTTFFTV